MMPSSAGPRLPAGLCLQSCKVLPLTVSGSDSLRREDLWSKQGRTREMQGDVAMAMATAMSAEAEGWLLLQIGSSLGHLTKY